ETIPANYAPGDPHRLRTGKDLLIVATGLMVGRSARAADLLAARDISATVLDVHTLKPFSDDVVAGHAAEHQAVLVVEEHNTQGGLGTMVQEALGARRIAVPSFKHGLQDEFAIIGPPNQCYRYYGLDDEGIALVGERLLEARSNSGAIPPLWGEADRQRILEEVGSA